jgi:CheY-like chemotaxis protein
MQGIREKSHVHGYRTATVRAKGPVECLAVTVDDMLSALGKDELSRVRLVRSASFKLDQNEEVRLQLNMRTSRTSNESDRSEEMYPFNPTRRISVLYAEDSMPTQMIVKAFLRKLGNVDVTIAADGKKALDAHASINSNFDLILMDCQMPVMDGLEATTRIRELGSPKSVVPIVGVSSGVEGMSAKECHDVGMNDFVSKPLNVQKLTNVIRKTLPALFVEDQTSQEETI